MISIRKQSKLLLPTIFIAIASLFFSCKKTDNAPASGIPEQTIDFTKKVIASVNGFVTNENNEPVNGAVVKYGALQTTTNLYGFFQIKDASVTEDAGFVTVTKNGYFNGIRTFVAKAGQSNFCRIKLIPKTVSGSIQSGAGGSVNLPNGLSVSLPADAVIDAVTKTAYNGTVNISSAWIDPVSDELDKIMPGDLRGISAEGYVKALTTYGMTAVELTGSGGQLLQVADGKKATLTFTIPSAIVGDAPATTPLWYFNETTGLWKEEGTATKSGNAYVGEVKHFSVWNCDVPGPLAKVSLTLTDSLLNPISNICVQLTNLSDNRFVKGYTNEAGFIHGNVLANAQYKLELFYSDGITKLPYSKTFYVGNGLLNLGIISIGNIHVASIKGTATDCNNSFLTNGRIIAKNGGIYEVMDVDQNGLFKRSTFLPGNSAEITLVAINPLANQQSNPVNYTLHPGINDIGNLAACGTNMDEFVNLTINGQQYILGGIAQAGYYPIQPPGITRTAFTAPLLKLINGHFVDNSDEIRPLLNNPFSTYPGSVIGFYFTERGPSRTVIPVTEGTGAFSINPTTAPTSVSFSEYGDVGGYIAGVFSGAFYYLDSYGTTHNYNVSCSFRLKRTE